MRTILCDACALLLSPPPIKDCKGCRAVKARRHYQRHAAAIKATNKEWRKENPEKNRESNRRHIKKYRQTEKFKAWRTINQKKRRERFGDYINQTQYEWRVKNREKYLGGRAILYSKRMYGDFADAHRLTLELTNAQLKKEEDNGKHQTEQIERPEPEARTLGNTFRRARKANRYLERELNRRTVSRTNADHSNGTSGLENGGKETKG